MRGDPLAVACVGEHVTVEPRQRAGAQGERRRRIAAGAQLGGLAGHVEHVEGIDRCGLDVQHVSGSRPGDKRSVAERPSQPGDLGLQRVASDARRLVGPQVLDQPLRADQDARFEGEPYEQLGRLARPDGNRDAIATHLDRTEHRHRDHTSG